MARAVEGSEKGYRVTNIETGETCFPRLVQAGTDEPTCTGFDGIRSGGSLQSNAYLGSR